MQIYEGKRAVEVAPTPAGCGVRFTAGSSIEADVVVLAINGWLAGRAGGPAQARLGVTAAADAPTSGARGC